MDNQKIGKKRVGKVHRESLQNKTASRISNFKPSHGQDMDVLEQEFLKGTSFSTRVYLMLLYLLKILDFGHQSRFVPILHWK